MWVGLASLIAAFGCAAGPAAAAKSGALLTPDDVPGLSPAGQGKAKAMAALGTSPPKQLRKAATEGAGFRAKDRRLDAGVFTLDGIKQAKRALRALGRGARKLDLGDGAVERRRKRRGVHATSVAVRVGEAIGAVSFGVGGGAGTATPGARAYAEALAARLDRVLSLTAWQRTLDGIAPDGSITPALALRAFSIAYGPVPGVKRPKGPIGTPESATLAMQMVARVWDQLSPEQRAAIDVALGAPHDAASPPRARMRAQELTPDPGYQALAEKYVNYFRSVLPGSPAITVRVFKASENFGGASDAWADALPVNADGQWGVGAPAYCRVRVPPKGQAEEGRPFFELVMAHEVFHCVQFSLMSNWRQRSAWIIEGMADWAAVTAYPTTVAVGGGPYRYYLQTPATPLFARAYDATGFWGRIDEYIGKGSLWANIPAILAAPTDAASFDASGASFSGFLESWASAMWRFPSQGWNQADPYSIPFADQGLPHAPITDSTDIASDPYVTRHFRIVPKESRPLVSLESLAPYLRVGSFDTDYGPVRGVGVPGLEYYCFGKCKCPPGKVGNLPPNVKVDGASLFLGQTGGATAATARVEYHDPKRFCDDEDPGPDRPSGPGGTNGDPHMTSMDGLHYDFQAAGEFSLTRSDSGDLAIQARQEPWLKSRRATINTQLAMLVEGHRVTVSAAPSRFDLPIVRIDGTVDPLPAGASRTLGAAAVSRHQDQGAVEVTWPDGSNAIVRGVGAYGVAARIELAAGRANAVSGLLGDFDGNPGNDLATRADRRIRYKAKASNGWEPIDRYTVAEEYERRFFDDLYDVVGDSWRIKQSESLFDYAPGETTRTFTDRSIPERPVDPDEINRRRRAEAERICREAGVTQPGPLADCIVDVFVTGRAEFAADAVAEQEAALAGWSRLAAGASRTSDLSLLETADGALHIGFGEQGDSGPRVVDVRVDANRAEAPPEAITSSGTAPFLFRGPGGGVRAETPELTGASGAGIYQHARSADGTWTALGAVATGGYTYASRPFALFAGDELLTVSPMAGVARLFQGESPSGPGVEPTASQPDCYATSPALARDGATGEVWVAWVQWDCPQTGVFVQQVTVATGELIGSPLAAPGTTGGSDGGMPIDRGLGEPLAFTGRPGEAGVFLAFPADRGERVALWKVGDAEATSIRPQQGAVGQVDLVAEPQGGELWVAWSEGERLLLGRTTGGPLDQRPRPLAPPRDATPPLFTGYHWDVAARDGALDVLFGYPRSGGTPGAIWHARVRGR